MDIPRQSKDDARDKIRKRTVKESEAYDSKGLVCFWVCQLSYVEHAKTSKRVKLNAQAPVDDVSDAVAPTVSASSIGIQVSKRPTDKEHASSIEEAKKRNASDRKRGQVCCNKQVHYRDKTPGIDKRWPLSAGFKNISVRADDTGNLCRPCFWVPLHTRRRSTQ